MDEIIKYLQLILICNKNEEEELYNECVEYLKDRDFDPINMQTITNKLRKLKLEMNDDNKIDENELRKKLKDLFQIKNLVSYEYEQTMEILFESINLIDTKNQLDQFVYDKIFNNMKKYFQSEEYKNVSFSSLYLLLYYFYKKNTKTIILILRKNLILKNILKVLNRWLLIQIQKLRRNLWL